MTQVILVYADMSVYFYSFLMTSVNFKSKSSFMHIHFTFAWLIYQALIFHSCTVSPA